MATVTYRDIAEEGTIDPIDFLFKRQKLYVAQSALTPELVLRYYEALVERIPVEEIVAKSSDSPHGLESMQKLVSHEPNTPFHSHEDWRRLENNPVILEKALHGKVSYAMQYLPLQSFRFPEWEDMPHQQHREYRGCNVLLSVSSDALLVGKRQKKLFFASATWKPAEEHFWYEKRKPDSILSFVLSAFMLEEVTWQDPRIMERIKDGRWEDCHTVAGRIFLALRDTISAANAKARWMSAVAKDIEFAQRGIYHGR